MAERLAKLLDAVIAVSTTLLDTDADGGSGADALNTVAAQARRLADASAGIVLLPTGEGGLEVVAASADRPEGLVGIVIEPDSPVAAHLLAGEPVFVEDSATDLRMSTVIAPRFGPSMMLPLRSGGRVVGTLALPRLRGEPGYTEEERFFATQFAAQAALALLLSDSQRDRERLAVYEERDRIARDLHDLVIQRLFATGLMLQGAQRRADDPGVKDGIGRAVDELDATIQEVRTTIFALQQSPAETPSGLRTRVLREVSTVAVPLGFQPSVRFVGAVDARVGERSAKNLVAALREALSNVLRHAGATRVDVIVDSTAFLDDGTTAAVRLVVSDDGVGIPLTGRRSGLHNLVRRAESLGGTSTFGSRPDGDGTAVVWEVPL
jgi:signal transduction histidine kinase